MSKKISILLSLVLTFSLLSGCMISSDKNVSVENEVITEEVETVIANVTALKGPTGMGLVKMIEDEELSEEENYIFTLAGSPDEITPKLVKGDIDIAAVPANLASVLYNNTDGEIVTLAVNTLGVLYIVENGDTVNSIEDLKGKTIYTSGKGATPEYSLNYILEQSGVLDEVNIEFKSEHSEVLASVLADENGIAMLPQPFVNTALTKGENLRVALDLNKEWESLSSEDNSALITGVIVARRDFIEENPEKVEDFLDEYEASVDFTNNNIEEASALIEKNNIVVADVAKKAIPDCNIVFIEGDEMKEDLSGYLDILFEANPQSVGGNVPSEDFYYIK